MEKDLKVTHTPALHYDTFSLEGKMTVSSLIPITAELNMYTGSDQPKDLVLDLSKADYIDSSGIRLIINLKKKMELRNQKFYLLKPSENVQNILTETKIIQVFDVINSTDDLENSILTSIYERYLPHTEEIDGLHKLNCSCEVCGSREVIGYLLDQNAYEWRWLDDNPFPSAFEKGKDAPFDFFSLVPVVCTECYMASIRVTDFNIVSNGTVAIRSTLCDQSKNLLVKAIKRRKKMMEIDTTVGENFFLHPREKIALYKAYELAEFCARTISVVKKANMPFEVGYLNYLAIRYAQSDQKEMFINNCRTWFTQALSKADELSLFELAMSYFVLVVSDLNLFKKKDASKLLADFGTLIKGLPPNVPTKGFNSPQFWYSQVLKIWDKEIEAQSRTMSVASNA